MCTQSEKKMRLESTGAASLDFRCVVMVLPSSMMAMVRGCLVCKIVNGGVQRGHHATCRRSFLRRKGIALHHNVEEGLSRSVVLWWKWKGRYCSIDELALCDRSCLFS